MQQHHCYKLNYLEINMVIVCQKCCFRANKKLWTQQHPSCSGCKTLCKCRENVLRAYLVKRAQKLGISARRPVKRLVLQPAVREQWLWRVARNLSNCLICIINSESSHSPRAEINRKCIQANFQKEVICFPQKSLGLRSHTNWISITESSNRSYWGT